MIKNIFIILIFLSVGLFASFFPSTIHSKVKSIEGKQIVLTKPFPRNGMSGVVLHHFAKGVEAISAVIVQTSPSRATIYKESLLGNRGLPSPKQLISVGDRVIGGYLYHNILTLAPNSKTYAKVVKSSPHLWIHPDLYASFLAQRGETNPSPSNLNAFAKVAQIGLVYIVQKDRAILYDPISRRVVSSRTFHSIGKDLQYPFYNRFFFKKGDYYKSVGFIK